MLRVVPMCGVVAVLAGCGGSDRPTSPSAPPSAVAPPSTPSRHEVTFTANGLAQGGILAAQLR